MTERPQTLADRYWDYLNETNPTSALLRGDHRFDDEMEDASRAAEDAQIEALEGFAAEADAIDAAGLSRDEEITRATLSFDATAKAVELRDRYAEFDVNPALGIHALLLSYVGQFPITEPAHAEAMPAKFEGIGRMFRQLSERLRQGVAKGRTPHQSAVTKSIAQIDEYLAGPIDQDPFVRLRRPEAFDDAADTAWRDRLAAAVQNHVRPGFLTYRDTLHDEVLPKARSGDKVGVCWLPDGEALYTRAVARHTTLEMTPMEIHRIGQDEIGRLAEEYRDLGSKVLGTSDVAAILDRLRTDPALRFDDRPSIKASAEDATARAVAAIPQWFGRLPQAPCIVAEIPDVAAKDSPLAFYLPPAEDGSRPGTYFVNTYDPTTRTRYESEALAFHEGVPGHHLQNAIAQELDGVPAFRRNLWITSYGEGWGLYTERLSDEMGLYSGDLERMGILSFDSWRAGRLVVDTGMHALGWSMDEAVAWLTEHSPQAANNIVNEVERYIGWPGQALAYKIGQREIFRLRAEAQDAMGDRFDIRGFHDTVLGSGPVPLPVLGDLVRAWSATG
jgi:uncharacterized protein (DUF885 family)